MSLKTDIRQEKDVVRRNHLQRQLNGPQAIADLTDKVDEKKLARIRLTDAVAKLGRRNRIKAEKQSQKNRLKAKVKAESNAKSNPVEH